MFITLIDKNDPQSSEKMRRDNNLVNTIIMHTTGVGIGYTRLVQDLGLSGEELYNKWMTFQSRLEYLPHISIDPLGRSFLFAPFENKTWHAGVKSSNIAQYNKGQKIPDWWKKRNSPLSKPTDFPCYIPIDKKIDVNARSIGVDLLPLISIKKNKVVNEGFTEAQYSSLNDVIVFLCDNFKNIKCKTTHSDVDPISRSTKAGPWDFGPDFDRNKVFGR